MADASVADVRPRDHLQEVPGELDSRAPRLGSDSPPAPYVGETSPAAEAMKTEEELPDRFGATAAETYAAEKRSAEPGSSPPAKKRVEEQAATEPTDANSSAAAAPPQPASPPVTAAASKSSGPPPPLNSPATQADAAKGDTVPETPTTPKMEPPPAAPPMAAGASVPAQPFGASRVPVTPTAMDAVMQLQQRVTLAEQHIQAQRRMQDFQNWRHDSVEQKQAQMEVTAHGFDDDDDEGLRRALIEAAMERMGMEPRDLKGVDIIFTKSGRPTNICKITMRNPSRVRAYMSALAKHNDKEQSWQMHVLATSVSRGSQKEERTIQYRFGETYTDSLMKKPMRIVGDLLSWYGVRPDDKHNPITRRWYGPTKLIMQGPRLLASISYLGPECTVEIDPEYHERVAKDFKAQWAERFHRDAEQVQKRARVGPAKASTTDELVWGSLEDFPWMVNVLPLSPPRSNYLLSTVKGKGKGKGKSGDDDDAMKGGKKGDGKSKKGGKDAGKTKSAAPGDRGTDRSPSGAWD